ncbi:MAG: hypothetical protein HY074_07350 [Deltaproteobacteria bacterium]|nr:hypothetical protein [Deltaproteobacteria bacterium]
MLIKNKKFAQYLSTFFLALGLVLVAPQYQARATIVCEKYLVSADTTTPKRSLESMDDLKVGTFNVENLFMHLGHHEPAEGGSMRRMTPQKNKPINKIQGVARAIMDMNLDIVVLEEVENIEALQELNAEFLEDRYTPVLVRGNDPRGIEVAFLVKKDLPFDIENFSFKNETWVDPRNGSSRQTRLFSRDLPALIVRANGQPKNSPPLFVFIGTHYKSKRASNYAGSENRDPESGIVRGAQVERTVDIIERLKAEYGKDLPILIAGDFNGSVRFEPEFTPLRKRGNMTDAFDALKTKVSDVDRTTHVYYPDRNSEADQNQIDAVFVSPELKDQVIDAKVYRYKDPNGRPYPLPKTKKLRDRNPSDHWPVMVTLKFKPLRDRQGAAGRP